MYSSTTKGVLVEVSSEYISERSNPELKLYYFAYHIRITNQSAEMVQLISRHWIITNADGKTEEVKGPGVIGEQPILEPGQSFSYSSFCPLNTPLGSMHGTYQMINGKGESFDVTIPAFRLNTQETLLH